MSVRRFCDAVGSFIFRSFRRLLPAPGARRRCGESTESTYRTSRLPRTCWVSQTPNVKEKVQSGGVKPSSWFRAVSKLLHQQLRGPVVSSLEQITVAQSVPLRFSDCTLTFCKSVNVSGVQKHQSIFISYSSMWWSEYFKEEVTPGSRRRFLNSCSCERARFKVFLSDLCL